MKSLPTLYKKTSTGAIQEWNIEVSPSDPRNPNGPADIDTSHGQVGGKHQYPHETISEGKNIGKANETTALQQAEAEALAQWQKKKKSGYVDSLKAAKAGELDESIEGGILPMLAFTFEKQGKKIKYPCYVQPKLDGVRCIAIVKDGKATLWSRTRKKISSMPHIIAELERIFHNQSRILDGELYSHSHKDNFEHIVHLVRQEDPDPKCTDVEYHIYDLIEEGSFAIREFNLKYIFSHNKLDSLTSPLKRVETWCVIEDQVPTYYGRFKDEGYEGCMLRNSEGLYVNKRSSDLIKVKEMQDEEYEICGIEEGRGKLAGHVGAFVCRMADGKIFSAKMAGETKRLRDYFEDHSLWKEKRLTVQFQDLTSYGIPRFPVGLRIRESE